MKTQVVVLVVALAALAGLYWFAQSFSPKGSAPVGLSADLYPLYDGVEWGVAQPHGAFGVVGYEVVSTPARDITDIAAITVPFEQYYREKLTALGWSEDSSLAAGGPGGMQEAYRKGDALIVLSFTTDFKGTKPDAPVSCPCDTTLRIFSGVAVVSKDPRDATYFISGEPVTLVDGMAQEQAAPGSSTMITTQYFGNEAVGDINSDGIDDVVFILTRDGGGSGVFFYAAAALGVPQGGFVGTNAVYLGDRIAPQASEYRDGGVFVNYADRRADEAMATVPSVGKSVWLKVVHSELVQVAYDFEGEADPSRMTLDMKDWRWVRTVGANGVSVTPREPGSFSLTLNTDGTFGATTDCNGVGGNYDVADGTIRFYDMISTLMFCEGSQEQEFTSMLGAATRYEFTSRGELLFRLPDGARAFFR